MLSLAIVALGFQSAQSCCMPTMSAFAADPAFATAHLEPLPLAWRAAEGHAVTWRAADGKPTSGFFVDAGKDVHQAVVLVHEFWGLNDYIRREAERLHEKTGYAVLAIDLYEGQVATKRGDAIKYMQGVDEMRGKAICQSAVDVLRAGKLGIHATKVGTVGFCFGGGWSFQTAVLGGDKVQACVVFYGVPDTRPEALAALKAPVLFIHPLQDKWITSELVADFQKKMAETRHVVEVLHYDAGHAFANPSNPAYDQKSADAAWSKTLEFFERLLG